VKLPPFACVAVCKLACRAGVEAGFLMRLYRTLLQLVLFSRALFAVREWSSTVPSTDINWHAPNAAFKNKKQNKLEFSIEIIYLHI
jgi:hypothetical protein